MPLQMAICCVESDSLTPMRNSDCLTWVNNYDLSDIHGYLPFAELFERRSYDSPFTDDTVSSHSYISKVASNNTIGHNYSLQVDNKINEINEIGYMSFYTIGVLSGIR